MLLGWWSGENIKHRHLWPGISVSRDSSLNNVNETINQIMITRGMTPESKGVVHWNISSLIKNPKLAEAVLNGPYKKNALVPASPWLDKKAPETPDVTTTVNNDKLQINWTPKDEKDVFHWVIYYQYGSQWGYEIVDRKDRSFEVSRNKTIGTTNTPLSKIVVTAVDRTGNESKGKEIKW